jgi:hypothetical protein
VVQTAARALDDSAWRLASQLRREPLPPYRPDGRDDHRRALAALDYLADRLADVRQPRTPLPADLLDNIAARLE